MNDKFCDRCSTIILTQYGGNLEKRRCADCQADIDDARQRALREVRDAIRAVHDYHIEDLERDERDAIRYHILTLFDKGKRFEIAEEEA